VSVMALVPSSHAQTAAVNQAPAVSEEARKHFVMGATLFKDAKTPNDYSQVVSEFKQATDLAPQWPDARYNLALAKDAAGDYSGAMDDLKLYQQFKLSDREARTAQDKIYALEAKQKKAAKEAEVKVKESSPEVVAAKKQDEYDTWLKKLDGARFVCSLNQAGQGVYHPQHGEVIAQVNEIVIRGKHVVYSWSNKCADGTMIVMGQPHIIGEIEGKGFYNKMLEGNPYATISDDGALITAPDANGNSRGTWEYIRQ